MNRDSACDSFRGKFIMVLPRPNQTNASLRARICHPLLCQTCNQCGTRKHTEAHTLHAAVCLSVSITLGRWEHLLVIQVNTHAFQNSNPLKFKMLHHQERQARWGRGVAAVTLRSQQLRTKPGQTESAVKHQS